MCFLDSWYGLKCYSLFFIILLLLVYRLFISLCCTICFNWQQKQRVSEPVKFSKPAKDEDEVVDEEDEEEHGETLCGACGENYAADEFWICCDICEKWFHGKCVKITPARAEHIKQYKCPSCSNKRARPWY